MFGAKLSQPISKIILGLTLRKFVACVTHGVCMTTVKTSCALALAMKSFGVVNGHIF